MASGSLSPDVVAWQLAHVHETIAPPIEATICILAFLALATLLLRLLQRRQSLKGFWLDDWLMLVAALPTTACVAAAFVVIHYGQGRHRITVSHAAAVGISKWTIVLLFNYNLAVALVKFSILALLIRIFGWADRLIRYGTIVIALYTFLWTIAHYVSYFVACRPFHLMWGASGHDCYPYKTIIYITSAVNIIGDFMVVLLPQPRVWKLQMPLRRKIALSVVMALGLFCSVTGVLRIALTTKVHSEDYTYDSAKQMLWAVLEPVVGVIAGCLPPAYQLVLACICARGSPKPNRHSLNSSAALAQQSGTSRMSHHSRLSQKYPIADYYRKESGDVFCGDAALTWKIERDTEAAIAGSGSDTPVTIQPPAAAVKKSRRESGRSSKGASEMENMKEIKKTTTISVTREA